MCTKNNSPFLRAPRPAVRARGPGRVDRARGPRPAVRARGPGRGVRK